jgi:glucose/arabinose dehydrogenase
MMRRGPRVPIAIVAALLLLMGVVANWAPASASLQDEGLVTPEAIAPAVPGGTLPSAPTITLVQVATELADPVSVSNAGDGSGRIFVVERPGRIRIIDDTGALLPDPFLDISPLSATAGYQTKVDFLEQGLLGLAFHPDYETNGLFYVSYSDYATNGSHTLLQYSVSADNANVADPNTGKLIMVVKNDPYVNHNGGTIHFGPDGYLYWAIGDGGLAGDPYDNSQNLRSPFGTRFRPTIRSRPRVSMLAARSVVTWPTPRPTTQARCAKFGPTDCAIRGSSTSTLPLAISTLPM